MLERPKRDCPICQSLDILYVGARRFSDASFRSDVFELLEISELSFYLIGFSVKARFKTCAWILRDWMYGEHNLARHFASLCILAVSVTTSRNLLISVFFHAKLPTIENSCFDRLNLVHRNHFQNVELWIGHSRANPTL